MGDGGHVHFGIMFFTLSTLPWSPTEEKLTLSLLLGKVADAELFAKDITDAGKNNRGDESEQSEKSLFGPSGRLRIRVIGTRFRRVTD